ncbi:hypothetical protein [Stenotrophomonas maltophilia]|uniref:Uncharacterized protein n=1 Tax=Stenotrophomonas maltophilia TaxID=40324 RepID=A0A2W6JC10_STEMA|nr:hypothetical protein [Stenotrophomonas maltophilia]PZS93375.1 hypothetical protein A7X83_06160 [Stenotrophomonas maltophilia]
MLDYAAKEAEAIQANLANLRRRLKSGKLGRDLDLKINNFALRYNLEVDLIRYKLLHDDLFQLTFIKDPARQSLHEKEAFNYLKSLPGVINPQRLPSKGPGSKYVNGGTVQTFEQIEGVAGRSKSIDFEWIMARPDGTRVSCFATHKHTKECGGSQDNQFKDVQSFMEKVKSQTSTRFYFFAICDGAYYERPLGTHTSHHDYLNAFFAGPRSKAVTINTLAGFFLSI